MTQQTDPGLGLCGLMDWETFLAKLDEALAAGDPNGTLVYFDVQRFKLINSTLGMTAGDRLLRHIADRASEAADPRGMACRLNADRFVFYTRGSREEVERRVDAMMDAIAAVDLPIDILCNAGIYRPEGARTSAREAVDCAVMAQEQIRGSASKRFYYYNEELRKTLLGELEIVGAMRPAMQQGQFVVYYQPQYNHATKFLVGAEALVRWKHPEKGLIPPIRFIPVFEQNGFVSALDLHVFSEVCRFQRQRLDRGAALVPVSVNLTRYDLFNPGFLEKLEETRRRFDVPAKYLRIELTESSALGGSRFINDVLDRLHGWGYTVEMDDFGSGYSSLNILKDVDFDIVKLDMKFFERGGDSSGGRGGIILTSVVRMINWLQLPVIAEGVETEEQADFLKSIGCEYIQGYLYAKPQPEADFEALLNGSHIGVSKPNMKLIETMDADRFWSSESLETLIFSNYVGGAAIFEYRKGGPAELLRVNQKYIQELAMNLSEKDLVNHDILENLDETGRVFFVDMLEQAIESGEERECETWRTLKSDCCGEDKICLRTTVRVIGRSKESCIFYAMIRNITREKQRWIDVLDNERRFKAASEQVNIYYWEYTVATHEMRPCFRCMRDLGFPALLTNYPESAFELGTFPPETQEMYRDMMRKIDEGAPSLEAVIPLTVGRIPFHVRYTTEFDEGGHPVKAYGSAALVVDNK